MLFVVVAGTASVVRLVVRDVLPTPGGLPLGTVLVNLAGAFALGLTSGWGGPVGTVAATAALGAFTTFSTFCSDVVTGWSSDRRVTVAYLSITLVAGVGLAWLGLRIAG